MNVRLAVAGQRLYTEEETALIGPDHASAPLSDRVQAALAIADAGLGCRSLTADERRLVEAHLTNAEAHEAAVAVGVFIGFADSIIIGLGLEPANMPVIVVPPPLSG
jgi:3-dehydroquinate dehydratase